MLSAVAVTLQRWPIVGRRSELEVFSEALSSGDCAGLVIHGRAGVGKTRLADECRMSAAAGDQPTERVVGSRTTALLPLGAVAALLAGGLGLPGPDGQLSTVALFERTRRALHERHHGRRLVTVADDVALLDASSLALLGYLAAQGTIFLIATVRTGEPVPDLVTGLWRDGRMARVDLSDLSRTHLDTLLHLALGGPIEAGAGRQLWEVTRGNPLYVHELVLGALESGALVERSGVWHLEDRLLSTSRLRDLVEQRIGSLSEQARSVVELLALCQPLDLGYLETVASSGVLESLERAGLVTIGVADGEVRLAHPLQGEVVRAAMPRLRARAILLSEAERLEAMNPGPGPASLRIAVWRLDAGGRPDPAMLLRGAHLARYAHDFRVVRRLIEALPGEQLDAVAALLLGEALYELGDFEAAERVLARGQQLAGGDHVALRLAVTRTKNAQWGLCQPEAALAINAAARTVITAPQLAEELVADEASILTFSGRPDRALAVLEGITGRDRRTRVVRAIAGAPALAAAGRTAEAVSVAEAGYADHVALSASAVRPAAAKAGAPAMARTTRVRRSRPVMPSSTARARSGRPENVKMEASSATSSSASGGEVTAVRAPALMASAASGRHRPHWAFLALVTARRTATCSPPVSCCPRARTRSAAAKSPSSYSASPSSSAPTASSCSPGTASIRRRTTRKSCA